MSDKFIVKQTDSKDSTVTVTVSVQGDNITLLVFDTDQNLLDDTNRAFQVVKAIREYASKRGYEMPQTILKNQMTSSRYSINYHRRVIRSDIKEIIEAQRAIAQRLEFDLPDDILFLFNDFLEVINN